MALSFIEAFKSGPSIKPSPSRQLSNCYKSSQRCWVLCCCHICGQHRRWQSEAGTWGGGASSSFQRHHLQAFQEGEVLLGVVQDVLRYGVFLQCGPAETVFLSNKNMPDYRYVRGDNPMFLNDKLSSKMERDTVVRFVVIGTQWLPEKREFRAVVGLDADYLGPVS
ncbi:hypothetical protein GBA52_005357 [Prunus armeniaca]|nr:hypothetical protein GBA52_005357 [Prunus armeniaca]